jgi:ABC-2 type transport system permease protein
MRDELSISPRRAFAILRKEVRHIARDVRVLFLVTLAPAFLLLMLSYVFTFDVERITLGVVDLDRSFASRDYAAMLSSDGDFDLVARPASPADAEALLMAGDATIVLVIPRGFEARLERGEAAPVQAVVDGINAISAQQGLGQLRARSRMYGAQLALRAAAPAGGAFQVRSRAWYNPALKSLHGMVPGLLAVVLFMPAMAVTLALARERETGSFEGLIATPVRGVEYLTGKVAAYLLAGLAGTAPALLVAIGWFQVPFRGNLAVFLLLTGLYFLATMGIGVLVANFVASQQTAMTIVLLAFFVPSFFISGLITPIDAGSPVGALVNYSLPTTHFIVITRGVFLKGLGLTELWPHAVALAGIALLMMALSLALFKKKVR